MTHTINLFVQGVPAQVTLEEEQWLGLIEFCERENETPAQVVTRLAIDAGDMPLARRVELYLERYFAAASAPRGFAEEGEPSPVTLEAALDAVEKMEEK